MRHPPLQFDHGKTRGSPLPSTNLPPDPREKLGVCQWFHFNDHATLHRTIDAMHDLGVRHLRTGVSWADYFRPGGKEWYDHQMAALAGFDVLLSVWHTPPSIAEAPACNAPPRRLRDYADFIDRLITEYGDRFTHLELWNEPNNRYKWDFPSHDPQWRKFGEMIGDAAYWARQRGRPTVLGGMIPIDPHWLDLMRQHGTLPHIDVVAVHGFPGMWFPNHPNWEWHGHWRGWPDKIDSIRAQAGDRPVWVTETGIATWDLALNRESKYELQVAMLEDAAANCPAQRVYWYSVIDLDPARDAIEGFHVDENEYHMGLITHDGRKKHAYHRMKELLSPALTRRARAMAPVTFPAFPGALPTSPP